MNCVVLGMQSHEDFADLEVWEYLEITFIVLFSLEILFRVWYTGWREHLCGHDWAWNMFDVLLIIVAVGGEVYQGFTGSEKTEKLTILRLVRFMRLARVIRIFRLR